MNRLREGNVNGVKDGEAGTGSSAVRGRCFGVGHWCELHSVSFLPASFRMLTFSLLP